MMASPHEDRGAPDVHTPRGRADALLPPVFFAAALVSFGATLAAAPFLATTITDHFYQTRVLALVHGLTLGWISMTMLGVLYRYVPALAKRTLPFPRTAALQAALFCVGVAGLVAAFWAGRWTAVAAAAGLLVVASGLACVNLWPPLLGAPRRGVAEVGVLAATVCLVAAATLGTLLALDKGRALLGGSLVTNLGAHAHLAGVGWVGITICALSFRFLPAFLLPAIQFPEAARGLVVALLMCTGVLVVSLLAASPLAPFAAGAVALTLVAYLATLGRVVASHRMPFDWTTRHAFAGGLWLLVTIATGLALAIGGTDSALGARLAALYGVSGILGWMSNLVIGISYKLFPGFVAGARIERGRRRVPVTELAVSPRTQRIVFAAYNGGVLATAAALLAASVPGLVAATTVLGAAALLYVGASFRTVAFAVLDPRPPTSELRILD